MPRALIAEDEPLQASALRAELARAWPELQVVAQVGDGLSAVQQALALLPELCLLDIRMPGCSGLDAAQALAEDWPDGQPLPLLVFVTAYEQYALAAFEAQAADYLVKPVQPARLHATVLRLQRRLAERSGAATALAAQADAALAALRTLLDSLGSGVGGVHAGPALSAAPLPRLEVIPAQAGARVHLVPVDEVIYFEAADKYLRVVTAEREHLIRLPLKDLLPRLDPARFWQVHRGTVVQARCIASARRDDTGKVLLNLRGRPETLVASRLYAQRFRAL